MSKIRNAFLSLLLDKKAREAAKSRPQRPQPAALDMDAIRQALHTISKAPQDPTPEEIRERLEQAEQDMAKKKSPERLDLIREAMKIRTEKAKLLDELSDEQRQKLQALAVKSFLNEG